jgi:hypothetical protein
MGNHSYLIRPAQVIAGALIGVALCCPWTAAADQGTIGDSAVPSAAADTFVNTDRRAKQAGAKDFAALRDSAARDGGAIRVIVGLRTNFTPEGALSTAAENSQRDTIARKSDEVVKALRGTEFDVVHRYESVAYIALKLAPDALKRLQASGLAASIEEDEAVPMALSASGPLVEATESAAVGRAGLNQHIAVLDTGVQKAHLFLRQADGTAKVVSEACYSANAGCPGSVTSSTAAGSGEPCTWVKCDHGTHVAGIAAGRGTASSGVARDAKLVSIRIFSNVPGCGTCTYTSDQIKGLERVNALSGSLAIASVNMSIGGGMSQTNCDADSRKPIIDTLRSKGIATVIASGNAFFNDAVEFPSCISTAITVGSTTTADAMSPFSNSSPLVELLAPGSAIVSSLPDSTVPRDAQGSKDGTSMATPHVAGAWAVLKAVTPGASVPTVLSALQSTGKPITDADNGVTKPRIRVLTAGTRLADTGLRVVSASAVAGQDMASGGVGLRNVSSGVIKISGIPANATLLSTKLIWTTIGGPDPTILFNGVPVGGTLAGASKDTCWNINQLGANRTYYRALTPKGNGAYTISGVGGPGGAAAQGASLVTTYRKPSGGVGRVYQRIGASSAVSSTAATTLTTTGSGVHFRLPAFHIAMGDGQAGTESPLSVNGTAITAANFFSGARGPFWDDNRIRTNTSLIGPGPAAKTVRVTGLTDCLVLTHAAVSYETTF